MWFSFGQLGTQGKTHPGLISAICFGFCQVSTGVQTGTVASCFISFNKVTVTSVVLGAIPSDSQAIHN